MTVLDIIIRALGQRVQALTRGYLALPENPASFRGRVVSIRTHDRTIGESEEK